MIRVGFIITATDRSWIGGLNYLGNLIVALLSLPTTDVQPVLLVSSQTPDDVLAMLPSVETIRHVVFAEGTRLRIARKILERGIGRDIILERLLNRHQIDVISHSDQLGRFASVPTIGWIADFQHRRIPEFFQANERDARDRGYKRLARNCSILLLSSHDALGDLAAFAPEALPRAHVLSFVSTVANLVSPTSLAALNDRYGLPARFFFLPNQFWAHKNHGVVIDALLIARDRGWDIDVVCTGKTDDRRQPSYFTYIEKKIRSVGLVDQMRILGVIPYADIKGLFCESMAVINPSLFEGWSTSVEEAKSLGKAVLLSDIPVHREQGPTRAHYFDPMDANALADLLIEVYRTFDPIEDVGYRGEAAKVLSGRVESFARQFVSIVAEAVAVGRPR